MKDLTFKKLNFWHIVIKIKFIKSFLFIALNFLLILNFNAHAEKSKFGYKIYEIDDSDLNIRKLYKNIINNKKLLSKNKRYFKAAKKGKVKNKRIKVVVLSVYFDYEKEVLKLTNNPNNNAIDISAWA